MKKLWNRLLKAYHESRYGKLLLRAQYHRMRLLDLRNRVETPHRRTQAERIHNELRRMNAQLDAEDALLEEPKRLWN